MRVRQEKQLFLASQLLKNATVAPTSSSPNQPASPFAGMGGGKDTSDSDSSDSDESVDSDTAHDQHNSRKRKSRPSSVPAQHTTTQTERSVGQGGRRHTTPAVASRHVVSNSGSDSDDSDSVSRRRSRTMCAKVAVSQPAVPAALPSAHAAAGACSTAGTGTGLSRRLGSQQLSGRKRALGFEHSRTALIERVHTRKPRRFALHRYAPNLGSILLATVVLSAIAATFVPGCVALRLRSGKGEATGLVASCALDSTIRLSCFVRSRDAPGADFQMHGAGFVDARLSSAASWQPQPLPPDDIAWGEGYLVAVYKGDHEAKASSTAAATSAATQVVLLNCEAHTIAAEQGRLPLNPAPPLDAVGLAEKPHTNKSGPVAVAVVPVRVH